MLSEKGNEEQKTFKIYINTHPVYAEATKLSTQLMKLCFFSSQLVYDDDLI